LAKVEMLRLMTCWVEFDPTLPLKGTWIMGFLPMTIQTLRITPR
jgi:S-adenosylhomocysteine hydrolase